MASSEPHGYLLNSPQNNHSGAHLLDGQESFDWLVMGENCVPIYADLMHFFFKLFENNYS